MVAQHLSNRGQRNRGYFEFLSNPRNLLKQNDSCASSNNIIYYEQSKSNIPEDILKLMLEDDVGLSQIATCVSVRRLSIPLIQIQIQIQIQTLTWTNMDNMDAKYLVGNA